MARTIVDSWLPVDFSGNLIQSPAKQSAVEAAVPHTPMHTATASFPRSVATLVTPVAKGSAVPEDGTTNGNLLLAATRWHNDFRFAAEDLEDLSGVQDLIAAKQGEWTRAYAIAFDNAALAVTAASTGAGTSVPYTSLYKSLRTTDATTGYTADANYKATTTGTPVSYSDLSGLLSRAETGQYFDPNNQVIIAHPSLRATLRGITSSTGQPIFTNTDFGGNGQTPMSLFGLPIYWSLGMKTSATATGNPTGNALIAVVNPNYLILGDRTPVQAKVYSEVSQGTDEVILAMRRRVAFGVSQPSAHGLLEIVP